MNITLDKIDAVNAVVTAEITPEDYQDKVKKAIKDFRKNANMPGFRKGMVPEGLIKKQYGLSILAEEVNKVLQESLYNYIRDNKVNMLGEPLDVNEAKLAYQQCMSQENGTAAPTTTVAAQNTQTAAVATPAQTQQAATVTPQTTSLGDMYKSMEVYPYVNPYNTGMTGISLNLPTIPMYNRNLSYVA